MALALFADHRTISLSRFDNIEKKRVWKLSHAIHVVYCAVAVPVQPTFVF